jgi:hypothetical protein
LLDRGSGVRCKSWRNSTDYRVRAGWTRVLPTNSASILNSASCWASLSLHYLLPRLPRGIWRSWRGRHRTEYDSILVAAIQRQMMSQDVVTAADDERVNEYTASNWTKERIGSAKLSTCGLKNQVIHSLLLFWACNCSSSSDWILAPIRCFRDIDSLISHQEPSDLAGWSWSVTIYSQWYPTTNSWRITMWQTNVSIKCIDTQPHKKEPLSQPTQILSRPSH